MSERLTKSQAALLRKAVVALEHAKGRPGYLLPGQFRVFDGRLWPAIRRLRDLGLLTVDDYDGRGHHDVITLCATAAARAALSPPPDHSPGDNCAAESGQSARQLRDEPPDAAQVSQEFREDT